MFSTATPPKYEGPVNGRSWREKMPLDFVLPKYDEDYEALLVYLSISNQQDRESTLSMVYACPKCEVRVANESDMVTRPFIWSNDSKLELSLNATFKKTSNLVAVGAHVCCYRCHEKLFDYCPRDPFLLTIPMILANCKRTLLKREYRILSLTYATGASLFATHSFVADRSRLRTEKERLEEMQEEDYPLNSGFSEDKAVLRKLRFVFDEIGKGKQMTLRRIIAFDMLSTPYSKFDHTDMVMEAVSRLKRVHADFGAEFVSAEDLENHDAFSPDSTYDVAVLFRTGLREFSWLCHTDFNDEYYEQIGEFHILPWLVAGGNFLFADWGSYRDPLPFADDFDADEEAKNYAFVAQGTNKQPSLAKLLADGHYIGSFFEKESGETNKPKGQIIQKIDSALNGELLYPNWLFLHDYPSATFISTERGSGKSPYATNVQDAYPPRIMRMQSKSKRGKSTCFKVLEYLGLENTHKEETNSSFTKGFTLQQ